MNSFIILVAVYSIGTNRVTVFGRNYAMRRLLLDLVKIRIPGGKNIDGLALMRILKLNWFFVKRVFCFPLCVKIYSMSYLVESLLL